MPLNPNQEAALSHIEWLLNPVQSRRTGRSLVTALALARIALSNPGTWIHFWDHASPSGGRTLRDLTQDTVRRLLGPELVEQFRFRSDAMVYEGNPVWDWYPDDLRPQATDGWPVPTNQTWFITTGGGGGGGGGSGSAVGTGGTGGDGGNGSNGALSLTTEVESEEEDIPTLYDYLVEED